MKRNRTKILLGVLGLVLILGIGYLGLSYRHVAPAQSQITTMDPAPAALEAPLELKVLTLNSAGKPYLDQDRYERFRAMGAVINIHDPDIVLLREACDPADRAQLLEDLSYSRLTHAAYFESSVFGSGLYVLSAYPIVDRAFHRFQASTPWYALYDTAWWMGHGVGQARLEVGERQYLDLFVFQLNTEKSTAGARLRSRQWSEARAYVMSAVTDAAPALIVGDTGSPLGLVSEQALQPGETDIALASVFEQNDAAIALMTAFQPEQYQHEGIEAKTLDSSFVKNQEELQVSPTDMYLATLRIQPAP